MISGQPLNGKRPSRWPDSGGWVTCPQPRPDARLRLFCLPHAGGGASTYYPWTRRMPADIEVCPVQLPGRETRVKEEPLTQLPALVHEMAPALLPHLDRPFALFGHSMGALLGFELTRHLREKDIRPVHLFASAHRAPHLPDREPPVHKLPEPEFLEELRRLNGTPEEVLQDDELREIVVPVLRADFEVCETYTYQASEPLDCPITALGGLADDSVNRAELEAWGQHTRSSFSARMFPGDHFYLNSARPFLLQIVARELLST